MAANPQPSPEPQEDVDRIPCLECGKSLWRITSSHLRKHGLICEQYLVKHPGAPFRGASEVARRVGVSVSRLSLWVKQGKIPPPRDGVWNVTAIREYIDAKGRVRIPCLECRDTLGSKRLFLVITGGHLRSKHGITCRQYLDMHPDSALSGWADLVRQAGVSAPTLRKALEQGEIPPSKNGIYDMAAILEWVKKSPERRRKAWSPERRKSLSEWATGLWAKRAASSLPADYIAKPTIWSIVGLQFLGQRYVANKNVASRLDEGGVSCPYGQRRPGGNRDKTTWLTFSQTRAGEVFFNRIRKWLGKPGEKAVNSHPISLSLL
jgi:hypothetical protein